MVKTYTIESTDHRAHMTEHKDGEWVAKADYYTKGEIMDSDPELECLRQAYEALRGMDREAQLRALRWLEERLENDAVGSKSDRKGD